MSLTPSRLPGLVDWDLAAGTAAKLAPAGPRVSAARMRDTVESLREAADASVAHVHEISRLDAAADLRDSSVLVVDRATWSRANTQSFSVLMQPALERLVETRGQSLTAATTALGGRLTGVQLGTILSFLSSKVLGQYDPFAALAANTTAPPAGRLLLVAPNVLEIERELHVEPADFRLWVCLHEQTHRVQFAAAPWLRGHMIEQVGRLSESMVDKADTFAARIAEAARSVGFGRLTGAAGRSGGEVGPGSEAGILGIFQDVQEREIFSHLTAVMSLLEGHANVVMDGVDATVVPTVRTIRQRFNARGSQRSGFEKLIRQLLGLDAKMRQYSDGSRFVRGVVDQVGLDGFNRIWDAPAHLPTEHEIHHPGDWVARMGLGDPRR
ncbi:zinc-dependent metalloprotease [Tersicoccus sp. Bi-70]|uniref:zinc-dependent metalloprotease n=1 Tax=Tersicoccus sp. Bi-70 TaxID=1897634 RepID=UPI001E2A1715|nr:zinc-dependent metalloprotease [Tersicoccus sp. Bi-70]